GHIQLHHQRCSLRHIAEQTCELVQNQAEQKDIKLIWQVTEDVPEWVQLDSERLGQILLNIISNAVKFTDRGFVNLSISTTWREDRPGLRISVADSGIGIASEKSDLIFEPFAQVDGSDRRPYSGVGLGLAICRKLVDALDGTIKLRSIPGAGSEFVVWLPFDHSEQPSGQADLVGTAQKASADDSTRAADTLPRVLVVEDDRICGEFFKTYLSRNGYAVSIETDGNKAVERVKELKPDALILDLRLPGKNGLDILAELKSKPSTETIPVVVCSVLHCEDKALNLGALEYLCKPFTGHELLRVVHRAVVAHRTSEILAVDDEPTVRRLYDVALKRAGFKVITASGGREALELLAVHPQIGLVLLDLVMPGMSGFEVLERIRNSGRTNLPVIVVTARSMSAEEKQRLNGQVSAILHKASLSPQQLLEQIRTQLGQAVDSLLWADQPGWQGWGQQTLPLRQSDSADTLPEAPGTSAANAGPILIAEDVVYSRRFLEVLLERAGYRILSCSNGAQAVDLATKNRFGLIILDIQMPRVDGLEAAKLIREIPDHANTAIIALTAQAMKGDIQRCLQAGCTDYLAKPVREGELLDKIGKYLLPPSSAKNAASAGSQKLDQSLKNAQIQSQLAGDAELMKVVVSYIEDLPQMVNNMIETLRAGDLEALVGLAHNLKGSSGLAGFPDLASQAAQMQQAAQHKRPEDFAGILKKIVELCRMVGAKMDDLSVDSLLRQSPSAQLDRASQDKEHPDAQIESDRNFSKVQGGPE
ncbi:MAG: response regulator, partial [Phycisphaerae bacterium]|nr:response regulator [Phycisphaerae bacterium]